MAGARMGLEAVLSFVAGKALANMKGAEKAFAALAGASAGTGRATRATQGTLLGLAGTAAGALGNALSQASAKAGVLGGVLRGLGGALKGLGGAFGSAAAASRSATAAKQGFLSSVRSVSQGISRLGFPALMLFSGAFLRVGRSVKALVRDFAAVEQKFKHVEAVIGDQKVSLMRVKEEVRSVAVESGKSAVDIGEAYRGLVTGGLDARTAIQMLNLTAKAATIESADMLTMGKALAGTMTLFKLKTDDANQTLRNAQGLLDVMAFVSQRTATSIQRIGEAMKYGGGAARNLGMSAGEMVVTIGVLSQSMLDSTKAGTSFTSLMRSLEKPTKTAIKYLTDMGFPKGVISTEALKQFGGMPKLLAAFEEGLSKYTTAAQRSQAIVNIFTKQGAVAYSALSAFGVKAFDELMRAANNSRGSLEKMFDVKMDNWIDQVSIFKTALKDIGLSGFLALGDNVLKSFERIVKFVAGVAGGVRVLLFAADGIEEYDKKWLQLTDTQKDTAKAIVGAYEWLRQTIKEAKAEVGRFFVTFVAYAKESEGGLEGFITRVLKIATVIAGLGLLAPVVLTLAAVFGGMWIVATSAISIAAAMGWWVIIPIVAGIAAVKTLHEKWDAYSAAVVARSGQAGSAQQQAAQQATSGWTEFFSGIAEGFAPFIDLLSMAWGILSDFAALALGPILTGLGNGEDSLTNWRAIGQAVGGFFGMIAWLLTTVIVPAGILIVAIFNMLLAPIMAMWELFWGIGRMVLHFITAVARGIGDLLTGSKGLGQVLQSILARVLGEFTLAVLRAVNRIANVVPGLSEALGLSAAWDKLEKEQEAKGWTILPPGERPGETRRVGKLEETFMTMPGALPAHVRAPITGREVTAEILERERQERERTSRDPLMSMADDISSIRQSSDKTSKKIGKPVMKADVNINMNGRDQGKHELELSERMGYKSTPWTRISTGLYGAIAITRRAGGT